MQTAVLDPPQAEMPTISYPNPLDYGPELDQVEIDMLSAFYLPKKEMLDNFARTAGKFQVTTLLNELSQEDPASVNLYLSKFVRNGQVDCEAMSALNAKLT